MKKSGPDLIIPNLCQVAFHFWWENLAEFMCHIIHTLWIFSKFACIAWILSEGLYLHYQISSNVLNLNLKPTKFYAVGWITPTIFTAVFFIFLKVEAFKIREASEKMLMNSECVIIVVQHFSFDHVPKSTDS